MQNYTALEGDGYVDIAVQKVGTSDIPVSVLLSTSSSGTASGIELNGNEVFVAITQNLYLQDMHSIVHS